MGFEITQPFLHAEDADLIFPSPVKMALLWDTRRCHHVETAMRWNWKWVRFRFTRPDPGSQEDPVFAIRTDDRVVEAKGTFYAITEYQGQTYTCERKSVRQSLHRG